MIDACRIGFRKRVVQSLLLVVLCIAINARALAQSSNEAAVSVNRLLYNPWQKLDAEYVPGNRIGLHTLSIAVSTTSITLDSQAASFARTMFSAMAADGISNYVVVSGYRSYERQKQLFEERVARHRNEGLSQSDAEKQAATVVAAPGTSEHQSGYSMDISSTAVGGTLVNNMQNTDVGRWLASNAWRYGYTLRYPSDKTHITGVIFEPWHYRFVGAPHAQILKLREICLEEYVSLLRDDGRVLSFTDEYGVVYTLSYTRSIPAIYSVDESLTVVPVGADGAGFIVTRATHTPLSPLRWM